mmetsp:Transcript_12063/g.26027  ORF Transcript_12063/g.26027 Transcript_12063/m.26027 type:complete len:963 (+) Transcript_12063:103-2991(+)
MFYPSKKLLSLLALLPSTASAGREASVTKTFKFKEDFFIKFHPLPTAIGPNESEEVLMATLDDIRQQFKDTWINQIESTLQGGGVCTVNVNRMRLPEFSLCDWKYPDRYDVDELPIPGQCYDYEDGFIQRIYYEIKKLEITCPEDFSYDDLDKDAYTEAVFSGQNFLNLINPPDSDCDGDESTTCLFSGAETAEWSTFSECTAELYINRFVEVPMNLKCLSTDGYGRSIANKLITALDKYFEEVVSVILGVKILEQAPEGSIYNFASPYDSDRKYCAHGAYYAGGNLVNQIPDQDGILITQFTYGFDVIWYKPKNFDEELLPNLEYIINDAFNDGDFLRFLGDEYPNYDFIQDDDVCDVIDPGEVTFAPTEAPTDQPSEGPICDVDTDEGCSPGQVCRLSCVQRSNEPQCFDDEEERDCTERYGLGWICYDGDGDGIITASDNSNGCEYVSPTTSPSNLPTLSPVETIIITDTPTISPSTDIPTISPSTDSPTISPSLRPMTLSPTISNPPSEFIEPTLSPSHTSMPSSEPTPIPSTPYPSTPYPSTPRPTYYPTASSTSGDTETVDTQKTLSPTFLQVRPVETLIPTASPNDGSSPSTPSPTCPLCIIHPGDTEEDECPIVTTGTCGDGDRGDGICPYAGYCCSKWGYCGTTSDYCDDDSLAPSPSEVEGAPPAPTYSVDAGQCASGDVGDGFCPEESLCCSDWGYCGSGESYCFTTRTYNEDTGEGNDGTCGGGGVGDGACSSGLCCSRFGFCGEGELYCTGQNGGCVDDAAVDEAEQIINRSPLPLDLKPEMGFRCGVTEVDARSNCKSECTHHVQCSNGDECWGVQLNYCNAFEESGAVHPICTDLDLADNYSRCGYDEASARGYCGPKCDSDDDCAVPGEFCFPTLLNLCDCHGERCPEAYETYSFAKELISPYFVESDPASTAEGRPRNASFKLNSSVTASLLVVFASMGALVAML